MPDPAFKTAAFALGLAGLLIAGNGHAAAYRWTDAQGQVHYSQTPPVGRPYQAIPAAGSPVVSAPAAETPAATPAKPSDAQEFLKRAAEADARKRERADAEKKTRAAAAEVCAGARTRLAFLDATPPNRLMQREDGGEPRRVTSEQWEQERAAAGKTIKENCR